MKLLTATYEVMVERRLDHMLSPVRYPGTPDGHRTEFASYHAAEDWVERFWRYWAPHNTSGEPVIVKRGV